jgi:hypothetical protein
MLRSGKSLKDTNRVCITAIVLVNFLILYAVGQGNAISIGGLKALFTESTNLLPVTLALIAATIANGLLSPDTKARLVFLRWKHALPGHRAFTEYAPRDPRIDMVPLKKECGGKLPEDPVEQNKIWYRIYKTVENNPSVLQAHRDFLLTRDYAGLAALFVVTFGAAALLQASLSRATLIYCIFLVIQFIAARMAASTYGKRFVTTVLAERSAKPKGTASNGSVKVRKAVGG